MLANVQNNIPQGTKDYIADAKNKIFNRQHLRSPTVFFGMGEEKPFYLERVPSLVTERLRHNLSFFYLNYILITGVLFCLTMITSPSAIIGIGLLAFAWMAVIRATSEGSVQVKGVCFISVVRGSWTFHYVCQCSHDDMALVYCTGITITQKQASMGMGAFTALALIWLLSHIFWWTLSTSGFLTGVHMLLRDASMHKDEEDRIEMQGDLSMEDEASFLNAAEMA